MPALTLPQAFELALQHHQAGRLAEAEALYRQILGVQPNHADAVHLLGVIAHQSGHHELAVKLISSAIELNPANPAVYANLGGACGALGHWDGAIAAFRSAIRLRPDLAEVQHNLGNALRAKGELDAAVGAYRRAIELRADYADAHQNLGTTFHDQGRFAEATAEYRLVLDLRPTSPEAHNNLGVALLHGKQHEEAVTAFRRAVELQPSYTEAQKNLGVVYAEMGQMDQAVDCHHRALELQPETAEFHRDLANVLIKASRFPEAVAAFQRAIELKMDRSETYKGLGYALARLERFDDALAALHQALQHQPDHPGTLKVLGAVFDELGRGEEAIRIYRRALELQPNDALSHHCLGNAWRRQARLDEAEAAYSRALELEPRLADARVCLAAMWKEQGRAQEALEALEQARELLPGDRDVQSNLILLGHACPNVSGSDLARECARWNRQFAMPRRGDRPRHQNDRDPERRLRIGYVSPDFRDHVVGRNLLPLFREHDVRQCQIVCFSETVKRDETTEQFRRAARQWRDTRGLSAAALAQAIREEEVDILVDLSLYTQGNRLDVFALQPAPVQVSFAAYPGSTGLETIECRISDPWLEMQESGSHERVHLIDSFWCYDPCGLQVEVGDLPAAANGFVTFGCLADFGKTNDLMLRLWSRVLGQVPGSRLLLLTHQGNHRERIRQLLRQEGVTPERIEFVEPRPRKEYLQLYHQLDIVLDTFPYNGHTTSLDALWMGVPVVSLSGPLPVSRAGLSQLSNVGLPELAAHSEEDFVKISTDLANDLPRLAELRRTLRPRMEASVLMDAPRFARNIEAAYRTMWRRWCLEETGA